MLSEQLGVTLDPALLELAFTHRSFAYESGSKETNERGKKKRRDEDEIDLDLEDELMMDGSIMDLETPIRDAVVLSLPINPLCNEDCLGLCPDCGGKWADLPEEHAHDVIDARWASLGSLSLEDPDFKI